MMHAAFVRALEDAQGALPEMLKADIDDMSHMLVAQYVGLRVLVRSNVPVTRVPAKCCSNRAPWLLILISETIMQPSGNDL